MKPHNSLEERIKQFALTELDFDAAGICSAFQPDAAKRMQQWLLKGFAADMHYLHRHAALKKDPSQLLNGVDSAIVVAQNYRFTSPRYLHGEKKIARYAQRVDYHHTLMQKLRRLQSFASGALSGAQFYAGVDSRPIAERALALAAGIGFLGKNAMVIRPGLGSYFFIGVLLTTAHLHHDTPMQWDCGQCRACLDACPTAAITAFSSVDSSRCISYQTIEQKHELSLQQQKSRQGWIYGCDSCQEICPYNAAPIITRPLSSADKEHGLHFAKTGEVVISKKSAAWRSRRQLKKNIEAIENGR